MKKAIKSIIMAIGVVAISVLPLIGSSALVLAAPLGPLDDGFSVTGMSDGEIDVSGLVTKGLNYLMYAVAVISVVMIIFGGIRYATSGGNAEKVKSAKNTILYAVVGLAVALLALVIVKFVEDTAKGAVKTSPFSGPTVDI